MLTPFGKAIRRYRDDMNVNLKDMADALGVPSSFLSAIEHGRKPVPQWLVQATHEYFQQLGVSLETWESLAKDSPTHVKLDLVGADELEREVFLAVGRRFHSAPHQVKEEIRQFIRERLSESDEEISRDRLPSRPENTG